MTGFESRHGQFVDDGRRRVVLLRNTRECLHVQIVVLRTHPGTGTRLGIGVVGAVTDRLMSGLLRS